MNPTDAQEAFNDISLEDHISAGTMDEYHAEIADINHEFEKYLVYTTGLYGEVARLVFNKTCEDGRSVGYVNTAAVYLEYARPYMSA